MFRLESWTEAADLPCQGIAQEVQGDKKGPKKLWWTQLSPGLSAFSQKKLPKQTTTTT